MIIVSLIVFIGLLIFFAVIYKDHNEILIAMIAVTVSIVLFTTSQKMDKLASVRMLILLDDNKRKILEALETERSFKDLRTLSPKPNYGIMLHNNLTQLKEVGLIEEFQEFVSMNGEDKWVKKFKRTF